MASDDWRLLREMLARTNVSGLRWKTRYGTGEGLSVVEVLFNFDLHARPRDCVGRVWDDSNQNRESHRETRGHWLI